MSSVSFFGVENGSPELFQDLAPARDDHLYLERLFSETGDSAFESMDVVPISLGASKLTQLEAVKLIQERFRQFHSRSPTRLYQENQQLLQMSEDEYKQARCGRGEEILEAKWDSLIEFATQLQDMGYYTFAHAASFDTSLLIELQTYLQEGRIDPAISSDWNRFKTFRDKGQQRPAYENIEDYFRSDLCQEINDPESGVVDGWPNNQWLLSCDGYLGNKDRHESAYSLYSSNHNFSDPQRLFGDFLDSKFHDCWQVKAFGIKAFKKLLEQARFGAENPLTSGQGKVYLLSMPKEVLEEESTSYVYRSHPFGRVCECIEPDHEAFLDHLDRDQELDPLKCVQDLNPQYRMLIENFDHDDSKLVFSFSGLTKEQQAMYKEQFFWPLAYILKQLKLFANMDDISSQQDLEKVLSALPLDLSSWSSRCTNKILKEYIEKTLEPLYLLAIHQLVHDKHEILLKKASTLDPHSQKILRTLFERFSEDVLAYNLGCLDGEPNLINHMPFEQIKELFEKERIPLSLMKKLIDALQKDKLKEIARSSLGDRLFAMAADPNYLEVAAKLLASNPENYWQIPEGVDTEKLLLMAINTNPKVIQEASSFIDITDDFIEKAIKVNYHVFRYLSEDFTQNKKLALIGLEISPDVFEYLDPSLQEDKDILRMKEYGPEALGSLKTAEAM